MDHTNSHARAEGTATGFARQDHSNDVPRIDMDKAFFRIEVRPSEIHRWGVFALEDIPARRRVIEYTGEKIDPQEHERRSEGRDLLYFFTVSPRRVIDPSVGGSGAEYINHSCDGNMDSYTYGGRIFLSSNRPIEAGEELSYDYNIVGDYDVKCKCGAKNCRGTLQG